MARSLSALRGLPGSHPSGIVEHLGYWKNCQTNGDKGQHDTVSCVLQRTYECLTEWFWSEVCSLNAQSSAFLTLPYEGSSYGRGLYWNWLRAHTIVLLP